jgi:UDP-N-acetylmuramyl pentapeptide phosphotransferase/UDP-N-acetylglucosamine-1-phosphate transferase
VTGGIPTLLAAGITALIVTSVALPLLVRILRTGNLVDVPSDRSLHVQPTPRGAGIALALGVAAALAVSGTALWPLWLAPLGLATLGAWDDLRRQPAVMRLVIQTVIAAICASGLAHALGGGPGLIILGTLLIVATVNATNFMDGINGITGLHAIVWGVAYAIMLTRMDESDAVPLAVALAAVGAAFVPWNMPRARIFLGDSGSYLIGGIAGVLSLVVLIAGEPLAALCPLAIYAADTSWALARRFVKREHLAEAHRTHVFQQLVVDGWSHSKTALVTTAFTALCALMGLLSLGKSTIAQIAILIAVVLISGGYLLLPRVAQPQASP